MKRFLFILVLLPFALSLNMIVGTKVADPFMFKSNSGSGTAVEWRGFSRDYMNLVKDIKGAEFTYEYVEYQNNNEILNAVNRGDVDIGYCAITKTAEREATVDFTHKYFSTGFRIMVPSKIESSKAITRLANKFFSNELFWTSFIVLLMMIAFFSHLMWMSESYLSHNQDFLAFHEDYRNGIKDAFWWVISVMQQKPTGISPTNKVSKLFGTMVGLSSILTISLITAVTTVNLFNINNIQEISKFSDLSGRSVGTANATTSHDYLREFGYGINIKVYPNIGDTLKALDSGELEAVVYDQPILLNHILHEIRQNGKTQYVLVGDLFELQDYGIAVKNDTLKEYLNTGILQANRNPRYFSIYDSWFTPMEI